MTSRITGFIPAEETIKEALNFKYRNDLVANSSHVFSNDHNQNSEEREPDLCSCSPHHNLEENVSIVAPCNSCGGIKEVGRVLSVPCEFGLVKVKGFYPC